MLSVLLAMGCLACVSSDTTEVLASRSLDLTGDGRPEIVEVIGTRRTSDRLDVRLVIRAADRALFEAALSPLTRTVGFDAARRRLSDEEYRERVDAFGPSVLDASKFKTATEFETELERAAPARVGAIPGVISSDSDGSLDVAAASQVWAAIKQRGGTVFEYSPGGDRIVAIAWSQREGRFYRLVECC